MLRIISLMAVVLLTSASVYAEGGEHVSPFKDMAFRFVNFGIMATILYLVLSKPLKNYLATRSDSIKKALDEAKIIKEDAEKKLKEYQVKMDQLAAEAKELRDSLVAEGNHEKQRIVEEANKAAVRIKEQAKFAAEQEIKKARLALKEEVANIVAEMAEERIKREITDSDQERLVKNYLSAGGIH